MQKCLVLGGDGFIGSHLVEDLLQRGYGVRVFGRFKNDNVRNIQHIKKDAEIFSGDFLNTVDVDKAVTNVDYVFHLISSSSPISSVNKFAEEIRLNILPTINLLKICIKRKVKKIVFLSSGGSIYGNYPRGYPTEEEHLNPISPHAIGKLCIEQILNYYSIQNNLDYVTYRISNVYGERQRVNKGQGIIPEVITKALKGETIEIYGNTIRDYIYVKDVTSFIANNFFKKHIFRVYNLGSGKGIRLSQLLKIIRKETKITLSIKKLKRRPYDIERIILDTSRVRNEFNFSPKIMLENGIKRFFYDFQSKI